MEERPDIYYEVWSEGSVPHRCLSECWTLGAVLTACMTHLKDDHEDPPFAIYSCGKEGSTLIGWLTVENGRPRIEADLVGLNL